LPASGFIGSAAPAARLVDYSEKRRESLESVDSDFGTFPESSAQAAGGPSARSAGGEARDRTFSTTPLARMAKTRLLSGDLSSGLTAADFADFGYEEGSASASPAGPDGGAYAVSRRNTVTAAAELVSVALPDGSTCRVALEAAWRPADLIAQVALKRRIAVHSTEYALHVTWIDQVPVGFTRCTSIVKIGSSL
jgi:hypothetical protein